MHELFSTQPSNSHQALLLSDADAGAWQAVASNINRASILEGWRPLNFALRSLDNRSINRPTIAAVYLPGVLAFPAKFSESLFLGGREGLEFLPITVDGESWLILNCLRTVERFDERTSNVMRGSNGEIFLVLKLRVTDAAARTTEVFTLANSNRAQLFVADSFKTRVEKLGLQGLTFQPVGEIA